MESKMQTFIFDIDGTLIDTFNSSLTALKRALHDVIGKNYTDDELVFHFGITLEDALLNLKVDEKYYSEISSKINDYYYRDSKRTTIFNGIEQMLENLSKNDVTIGIVTSKERQEFDQDFKNLSITKYFKFVVCADDTINHKPSPDPIEKFIEITRSKKSNTIYIGDTIYDCKSAQGAGIKFGLATWGALDSNMKSDYFFTKPSDILRLI